MNTKEAGKKWNHSQAWVRDRCREGMIPLAEKNMVWNIPDDAVKPPCTRHRANELMKRLYEREQGKDIAIFIGEDRLFEEEIYQYLSNCGFVTKIKNENIEKEGGFLCVTKMGLDLIEAEELEKNNMTEKRTKIGVKVNAGCVSISAEHEVNYLQ